MAKILEFFVGKFGLSAVWYVAYIAFISTALAGVVSLTLFVFNSITKIYNLLTDALASLNTMSSDGLGSQIFGLLDVIGVIDGLVGGLPIIISAITTILFYYLTSYLYKTFSTVNDIIVGLKP